jgi:hypothetical protein
MFRRLMPQVSAGTDFNRRHWCILIAFSSAGLGVLAFFQGSRLLAGISTLVLILSALVAVLPAIDDDH